MMVPDAYVADSLDLSSQLSFQVVAWIMEAFLFLSSYGLSYVKLF